VPCIDDCLLIPDHLVVFSVVLALLSQTLFDAGVSGSSTLNERLDRANQLRKEGALPEAEGRYRLLAEEARLTGEQSLRYGLALNGLGAVLYDQGNEAEAVSVLEKALAILTSSSAPDDLPLALCRFRLGASYRRLGHYGQVEVLLVAASEVIEKVLGSRHLQTASVLFEQGLLFMEVGACAESEKLLIRSLRIWQDTLGGEHLLVGDARAALGATYKCLGQYAKAESSLQRSLSIVDKQPNLTQAAALFRLGEIYYVTSSFDRAESALRRSAAILEQFPQAIELRVDVLGTLAGVVHVRGRSDEAERLLNGAATIGENTLGASNVHLANIFQLLGDIYASQRKDGMADAAYRRSILLIEPALGSENRSIATILIRMAVLRQAQGRFEDARSLFDRALVIDLKTIGSQHPRYGQHLRAYAVLLRKMGRKDEAKRADTRARIIAQENDASSFATHKVDLGQLGNR